jgi:PAS domain S-box-containing protein
LGLNIGRLNIGPRLALSFVLIIVAMLIGDAIVLWQFQTVRSQAGRLNGYDQEFVAVLRAHAGLLSFHDKLEALADAQDAGRMGAEVGPLTQEFADDAKSAKRILDSLPPEIQVDASIVPTIEIVQRTFRSQLEEITELAANKDWSAVHRRIANQVRPLEYLTSSLVERVDQEIGEEQAQAAQNIRRVQQRVFIMVPATAVFTLLIAAALGTGITRSITGPLARLVEGSRRLARGEFDYKVPVHGNDELAHLGQVFNDTGRQLQDLYASLQNSEDRLRRVINTVPAYVWSTLPDGAVDFVNRRLSDSTGLSAQDLSKAGWSSIVHPDDLGRYITQWHNALATGEPTEIEARVRTAEREYRWMLVRNVPLRDAPGKIIKWYGTGIDIEARRRAEESLRQAQADLAHVNRVTTMGELPATLAHEVNQPIAAASINANVCLRLLKREEPDLEEASRAATRMVGDVNRAAEIISRVRQFFRKSAPLREPVDLNDLIRGMTGILRNELTQYSIGVRMDLAVDLPQVMADRVQLQQVLMNLMMNGIDAMKSATGARQLTLISQRSDDSALLVSVEDTGHGLPVEGTDQIFTAFFTTKSYGTGMGLSISRSIIESHGGRLWAGTRPDCGASFQFTLPAVAAAAERV